jgi:drug/metabolite transporter (DMT)-like permease
VTIQTADRRTRIKALLAYAMIYFVWGSTYLAIRVGVRLSPPLLFAASRFLPPGVLLVAWSFARGTPLPTAKQWASISTIAFLIFVLDYGLLFLAEQHVPSGLTAVMMATIPAFMVLSEIVILGTQKLTARLAAALVVGTAGVAVLVSRSLNLGGAPVDALGAASLIFASISWSIAAALNRRLPLPDSKIMSSGAQMLLGGAMLALISALRGEWIGFHPSLLPASVWYASAYLAVFGSILGFTAYVWLIQHESPTRVGTYAYVNPVVAVLFGWLFGGEPIGTRTLVGSACVLLSVVTITTRQASKSLAGSPSVSKSS